MAPHDAATGLAALLRPDDLPLLGLDPAGLSDVQVLRQRSGHGVYRVRTPAGCFVLKQFAEAGALEPQAYTLLAALDVPVLLVAARTEHSLLLEDLAHSPTWRPAAAEDMAQAATGEAVAAWYRRLHVAGARWLAAGSPRPAGLRPWVAVVNGPALAAAGEKLGLAAEPVWREALAQVEPLRAAYEALPQTVSYNDFAGENLALSLGAGPRQAIVYDYDCLTTGAAESDWRNVRYSLEGEAREAFTVAFGPVDERALRLDDFLAALEGYVVAARHRQIPGWARPLLESVRNGELSAWLAGAQEVIA